jgi:hypothetical protein
LSFARGTFHRVRRVIPRPSEELATTNLHSVRTAVLPGPRSLRSPEAPIGMTTESDANLPRHFEVSTPREWPVTSDQ